MTRTNTTQHTTWVRAWLWSSICVVCACAACSSKPPQDTTETATSSTSSNAKTPDPKPNTTAPKPSTPNPKKNKKTNPILDALEGSEPLAPTPKAQTAAGKRWVAEVCTVQGGPDLFGTSTSRLLRSIEWTADRVYIVAQDDRMMAFRASPGPTCTLRYDADFDTTNAGKKARAVRSLSSAKKGRMVVASHSALGLKVFEDQAFSYSCSDARNFVSMHPSGEWGLSYWVQSDVRRVAFNKRECTREPWVLRDLRKDNARKGPFQAIHALSITEDTVWVGGVLSQTNTPKSPKEKERAVVAFSLDGKEKRRLQSSTQTGAPSYLSWIHAIEPCSLGLCVLDSNGRTMTLWSTKGAFLGRLDLRALLGLSSPWTSDIATDAQGRMYMLVAQNRAKSRVAEGLIYRLRAEPISPPKEPPPTP